MEREITGCYIGDLLSWVMGRAPEDSAWLTVMGNINSIAVATLADVSCIVLVENAALDENAAQKAEMHGVNDPYRRPKTAISSRSSCTGCWKNNMKYYYDLHLHSCLSPCGDMDMTPNNITGMAKLLGLDIIALTDHNTCRNCEATIAAGKENGVVVVPGMELTTSEDIHAVCLFPDARKGAGLG